MQINTESRARAEMKTRFSAWNRWSSSLFLFLAPAARCHHDLFIYLIRSMICLEFIFVRCVSNIMFFIFQLNNTIYWQSQVSPSTHKTKQGNFWIWFVHRQFSTWKSSWPKMWLVKWFGASRSLPYANRRKSQTFDMFADATQTRFVFGRCRVCLSWSLMYVCN